MARFRIIAGVLLVVDGLALALVSNRDSIAATIGRSIR